MTDYKPRPPRPRNSALEQVKRCRKCSKVKPLAEFYYAVQATDKRQSHCKKCRDGAREERRKRTPHKADAQRVRMERFKKKLLPHREAVFQHYGNACYCCGETIRELLTIDHVNNDGHQQRRENRGASGAFKYKAIVDAGFPADLRLACYNCNSGRARTPDKICPHQKAREAIFNLPILAAA